MWYEMRRRQHRVYWRTEQWKGKTAGPLGVSV